MSTNRAQLQLQPARLRVGGRQAGAEYLRRQLGALLLVPKSGAGRGVAMHAQGDSSGVQCFNCSEYGHYRKECPQNCDAKKRGPNRGKPHWKNSRGGGSSGKRGLRRRCRWPWTRRGAKWCSLHNTASHIDHECLKQKINGNTGSANFANIYRPHQSQSPVNATVETTSEVTGGYMGGYSFMASTAVEPAPQAEEGLSGSEPFVLFGSVRGGGESTALTAISEEYDRNDVLG